MLMSSPAFSKNNSIITGGKILKSTIDMNNGVITSAGTPTVGSDVVNKTYCDINSTKELPTITVGLSGTTWTTILANTTGVFDIMIVNIVTGGATAKFTSSKNVASRQASVNRWGCMPSADGLVRLQMRWLPNSGIEIRKNGTGYDGNYKVIYFSVI